MKHYVLTRSSYGPQWTDAANKRRLAITRGITARLMAAQTARDWTWLVLVDPRDKLLRQRIAAFEESGVPVVPIEWEPANPKAAPWDRNAAKTDLRQKIAATGYRAPWREYMATGQILQTRIDDDDGFHPTALERFQRAAAQVPERTRAVLMLPEGFRVFDGRYTRVYQANNAMHSLLTPANDTLCIYDYGHTQTARGGHTDLLPGVRQPRQGRHPQAPGPLLLVDNRPGWLWVRHKDTISGHQRTAFPINAKLREMFPIDWRLVA